MSIADKVKIIDDCITREVEWADEPTDDIQDAWIDLKQVIKNQHIKEKYFTDYTDILWEYISDNDIDEIVSRCDKELKWVK